jgi:hypothetical protein
MKKTIIHLMLAVSILFGSTAITTKKANAGVIIMTTASLYAGPVLAVAGMFGGFGLSVTSIYWTIENLDKAWLGWGLFMLDEQIETSNVEKMIAKNFPELESYLVTEVAGLIREKSNLVELNADGYKEVVLSEEELNPVLEVLSMTNPELGDELRNKLTKQVIQN